MNENKNNFPDKLIIIKVQRMHSMHVLINVLKFLHVKI